MAKKKAQNGGDVSINLDKEKKFYKDYINSPNYRARLKKQGYTNIDQVIKERSKNAATMQAGELPLDTQYFQDSNFIVMNTPQMKAAGIPLSTATSHEFSHGVGALEPGFAKNKNLGLNTDEVNQFIKRNKLSKVNPKDYPLTEELSIRHDQKASESKADIDSLRYRLRRDNIYNTGTQQFDKNFLKKAKQKYSGEPTLNRLFKNFSDEDLIYLMNNIAAQQQNNSDMAKNGKKLKAQYGLKSPNSYSTPHPQDFYNIQGMTPPIIPLQDYGVKRTDPAADLQAQLGIYDKKKKNQTPTDWSNVATGALLLTNALLPSDPIRNPVVRPQLGYSPQPQGRGSQAIYKAGGKISNMGYKANSPDVNQPNLRIPTNKITMKGVNFPVLGISDTGDTQYMLPGGEYAFDGNYVDETPMKGKWGKKMKAQNGAAIPRMSPQQIDYFNNFNQFVEKQGFKGSDKLNNQAFSKDLYSKYQVENPNELTYEQLIPMAQNEQHLQKEFDVNFAKRKNLPNAAGVEKANITPYDGMYGPLTSTRNIPRATMQTYSNNKLVANQDLGYVPKSLNSTAAKVPRIPKNVSLEQAIDSGGVKTEGYTDPQTGDWVPVNKLKYGGKLKKKYNNGGSVQPLTEDTMQINGPSHADGGVPFMGIEAEGGETAFESMDGSVNIMGNMINPLTNRKFKEDSKRIAKKEQQIDKLLDYSVDLVNEADLKDKWEILKFNSGKVQMEGAIKKKEELQQSKEQLSAIQNAMLEYSEENNIDPDAFSKGQFKPAKATDKAQNGWRFEGTRTEKLDPKIKEFVSLLERKGLTGRSGKESGVSQRNTKSGRPSRHATGEALDAFLDSPDAYNKVLKDPELTKYLIDNGLTVLNEYDPTVAKKTGATAGHLHIGYDKGTGIAEKFRQDAASLYKGSNPQWGWGTSRNPKGKTIAGAPAGDQQNFEETTPPTYFNPKQPTYGQKKQPGRVGYGDYDFNIQNPTPYQKPSDAKGLSFTQILPELYTAATNQVESVFMQEYTPQLYQDYEVSFQDRLNENQASFSALSKSVAGDPSSLATLAGQKYSADSQVLADEFRTNQAIEQDVVNKNIALLNDAELKNLGLADTQFVRQSTAKSKTKQQNQIVLQSISDKLHYNALEQRTLRTYENLYPNYSFGEDYVTDFTGPSAGEAITWAPSFQPLEQNAQTTVRTDAKGNVSTTKKYPSTIQQDLQKLQLSTNKLKYNDYFLNQSRRIAKNFNKKP